MGRRDYTTGVKIAAGIDRTDVVSQVTAGQEVATSSNSLSALCLQPADAACLDLAEIGQTLRQVPRIEKLENAVGDFLVDVSGRFSLHHT